MFCELFNIRKTNQLRGKALKLDRNYNITDVNYDEYLFPLKSYLAEVIDFITPGLPFANIVLDTQLQGPATSILEDISTDKYTIKFNSDILDKFKNNLKDIFLDNDEIFDKPEFREYKDNKKEVFEQIYEYGLMFYLFHEYTHIKDGHLKYNNTLDRSDPNYYKILRALECRADNGSTSMIVGIIQIECHNRADFYKHIALSTLASYLAFKYIKNAHYHWDIQDIQDFDNFEDCHPLHGQRQYISLDTLCTKLYKSFNNASVNSLVKHGIDMIIQFEEYNQNKTNLDLTEIPALITYTQEEHDSLKEIHNTWVSIQDDVIRYSYLNQDKCEEWVDTPKWIMDYFNDRFENLE